jgi:hypothetical protein
MLADSVKLFMELQFTRFVELLLFFMHLWDSGKEDIAVRDDEHP